MAIVSTLTRPRIERVAENRAPSFVGLGSQFLFEIICNCTLLPEPEWEIRLMMEWQGKHLSTTPDALYWSPRIAIYADGPYHLDPGVARQDMERRNWLQWGGFLVFAWSNDMLKNDPVAIGRELEAAYGDRRPPGTAVKRAA